MTAPSPTERTLLAIVATAVREQLRDAGLLTSSVDERKSEERKIVALRHLLGLDRQQAVVALHVMRTTDDPGFCAPESVR